MGKGGWLGPVLLFDLIRLTRRGWATIFLARVLYIGLLLLALLLFYAVHMGLWTPEALWDALRAGAPLAPSDAPGIAGRFFTVMLGAQFAAVLLLTPAYTAGAIAEDRERRTLDFLLASDLSDHEIVLGKFLARVANLGLLLLAGLPVLGLVQLLGGVDPNLVLAGYLALALMMGSLGSLSVHQSIHARRPREALFRTYLIACGYLLFSTTCGLSGVTGTSTTPLEHIPGILGSGNPLLVLKRLNDGLAAGSSLGQLLPVILINYAIFHVVIMLFFLCESIRRLRPSLTRTPESPAVEYARNILIGRGVKDEAAMRRTLIALREPPSVRPAVSDRPLLWKELHVVPRSLRSSGIWAFYIESGFLMGCLIAGSTYLLLLLIGMTREAYAELINFWARVVGPTLACVSVFGVAIRAAGCLSRERERQTLDTLLATPLSNRAIVNQKWLGSILSVSAGWWCVTTAWILAALTGGIDWRMLPLLLWSCASFAALAAGLGLCCSLVCGSTGRATAVTLAVLILIAVPWLPGRGVATPVEVLILLTRPLRSYDSFMLDLVTSSEVSRALFSLLGCASFAAFLWIAAHILFAPITGRMRG